MPEVLKKVGVERVKKLPLLRKLLLVCTIDLREYIELLTAILT